jgi:hypothetical protein
VGSSGPPMVSTAVALLFAGDGLLGFTVRESESAMIL